VLGFPERVYVAGFRLGKTVRRREAREPSRGASVVGAASVRACEDVFPLAEIVRWA
jgi:hypothetical protein